VATRAAVASWSAARKRAGGRNRRADAAVVRQIQREAREHGATLANGGKGGLDPRLARAVFRRDGYRCTNKHCPTPKRRVTLDHISGHPKEIREDSEARKRKDLKRGVKMGHVNKLDALHTLCEDCHTEASNSVHARENAIEAGKKPPPMRGDRR